MPWPTCESWSCERKERVLKCRSRRRDRNGTGNKRNAQLLTGRCILQKDFSDAMSWVHQFCCRAHKALHVARMCMGIPCKRLVGYGRKQLCSPRTGYIDKRGAVKRNNALVDIIF